MRESTKICVEEFVHIIARNEKISKLQQEAVGYALYEFLKRYELDIDFYRDCSYDYELIEEYSNSKFSLAHNHFGMEHGVKGIYKFAHNVCKFIEHDSLTQEVFFALVSLLEEWEVFQNKECEADLYVPFTGSRFCRGVF